MNSQFGAGAGAGPDRRSSVPPNPIAAPPFPGFSGNLAMVPPPPSVYALETSRVLEEEVQRDLDPHRARAMAERLLEVQLLGLLPPTAPAHPRPAMSAEIWGSAPPHTPAPCLPWAPARVGEPHYPALHPPQPRIGERPVSGSLINHHSLPIHHHPKGTVLEMLKITNGESLPPTNGSSPLGHLVDIAGQTTVEKAPGGQSGHTYCNALEEAAANMVEEGDAHSLPSSLDHTCFRCGEIGHKMNLCPLSKEEAKKHQKDENKKRNQEALAEGNAQQMRVTNMVEEGDAHSLPSSLDHTCFRCGEIGHKMNLCPLSKEQAKKHGKDENKKRNQEPLAEGNAPFRPFKCFKCGIYGHRQIDCVASNEEIEKNKMKVESKEKKKKMKIELKEKKKMMKVELREKKKMKLEAPPKGDDVFHSKFGDKCFRCGESGHRWKDCLVFSK